jgi:hypothetical protein
MPDAGGQLKYRLAKDSMRCRYGEPRDFGGQVEHRLADLNQQGHDDAAPREKAYLLALDGLV